MSKQPPSAAAATDSLSGVDIGRVMSSKGPIVKCVLLRATSNDDDDTKMPAKQSTSSKNNANDKITAAAQRDVSSMSIKEIKAELSSYDIDASSFVEKDELIKALEDARSKNDDEKQQVGASETTNSNNGEDSDDDDEEEELTPEELATLRLRHSSLISEISIDTTPKKSMVQQILGGPFTFLGQYEEEGIMVMIRRPDWELENETDSESEGVDSSGVNEVIEKGADNLPKCGIPTKNIPPVNIHKLQPPLDNVEVRGDILLMKVAETEEELDNVVENKDYEKEVMDAKDDDSEEGASGEKSSSKEGASQSAKKVHVPTNDDFFLDYTKDEYLKFAARTDIVVPEMMDSSDEEDDESVDGEDSRQNALAAGLANNDGEDDEHDEDFDPETEFNSDDEDFDSEEHQVGMMNLILSHMLRKFREENGRGPDSLELLEMRKALADRLGVDVPPVDEEACDWDKKLKLPTPKKHDKKVVVAEEKNETSPIPARTACGEGKEEEEESGDEDDDVAEAEAKGNLKRPVEEKEEQSMKKARLNGDGDN